MEKNIILAGVPRSGSTLVCHLLGKLSNTIALHEPLEPLKIKVNSNQEYIKFISRFINQQREMILEQGYAISKSAKGKIPDNHIGGLDRKTGKRVDILDGSHITVSKALSADFLLAIKQPGMFTAMLPVLSRVFTCYATIRNPLSVLRSWNSVDMAVTNGHAPAAEKFDHNLKTALMNEQDVFQRQISLLSWFFEQIDTYLPEKQIIHYEDLIRTNGKTLSCITPLANELSERLETKNNNPLYNEGMKTRLLKLLLDSDGFYWKYYSKDELSNL